MNWVKTKHISKKEIHSIQIILLDWFSREGRHFPWRNKSTTNYEHIISEVLLQRTKAETVNKFFNKFIAKYPSWRRLSNASEQELKEILKPIGLYRQRGSRLYQLAQELSKRKGRFPKNLNEVEKIPMMGQYLLNSYKLFILKIPSPLIDVNMSRVLERYFGPRELSDIRHDPYLQELSHRVVDHIESKRINWAILDFASIQCKARNQDCTVCIIKNKCFTYLNNYDYTNN